MAEKSVENEPKEGKPDNLVKAEQVENPEKIGDSEGRNQNDWVTTRPTPNGWKRAFLGCGGAALILVLFAIGWGLGMFSSSFPQLQVFLGEIPVITRIIERTIVVIQAPLLKEQTATPPSMPTNIPTSQYLVSDLSTIKPELPQGLGQHVRSIEDDLIYTLDPIKDTLTHHDDRDLMNQGEIDVWRLDQPLTQSGYYELFFLDKAADGVMNRTVAFHVINEKEEVPPVTGSGSVDMRTNVLQDTWRSFGIYSMEAGKKLMVYMDGATNVALRENRDAPEGGEYLLGEESLMVVKLPEDKSVPNPGQELARQNVQVIYVVDDNRAFFSPDGSWKVRKNLDVWNDQFHFINAGSLNPSVRWFFPLPPGDYNLYMFIPSELVTALNVMIKRSEGVEPSLVKIPGNLGENYGGKHYLLGTITIEENDSGSVAISMTPVTGSEGTFACDAIVVGVLNKGLP